MRPLASETIASRISTRPPLLQRVFSPSAPENIDLYMTPPDIVLAKDISKKSKLYLNESELHPYDLCCPVDKMINLEIGMRVYLKCLQYIINISVFMLLLYTVPSLCINFYIVYFELSPIQSNRPFLDFMRDIIIYPMKEIHEENYLIVQLAPFPF